MIKTSSFIILAVIALTGITTSATAENPIAVGETSKGKTLVDANGMTHSRQPGSVVQIQVVQ